MSNTVQGRQGELQRCVVISLTAASPSAAPTQPPSSSAPHWTMSPRTPTELETSGIEFFIEDVVAAGPYTLKIWKRDPTSLRWALRFSISGATADQWFVVCALNASELYFEIAGSDPADGECMLHVAEIGA